LRKKGLKKVQGIHGGLYAWVELYRKVYTELVMKGKKGTGVWEVARSGEVREMV